MWIWLGPQPKCCLNFTKRANACETVCDGAAAYSNKKSLGSLGFHGRKPFIAFMAALAFSVVVALHGSLGFHRIQRQHPRRSSWPPWPSSPAWPPWPFAAFAAAAVVGPRPPHHQPGASCHLNRRVHAHSPISRCGFKHLVQAATDLHCFHGSSSIVFIAFMAALAFIASSSWQPWLSWLRQPWPSSSEGTPLRWPPWPSSPSIFIASMAALALIAFVVFMAALFIASWQPWPSSRFLAASLLHRRLGPPRTRKEANTTTHSTTQRATQLKNSSNKWSNNHGLIFSRFCVLIEPSC